MATKRRRIPDHELHFIEDCLALLHDIHEAWKRCVYYSDNDDALEQLAEIKRARLALERNMQAWLTARKAALAAQGIEISSSGGEGQPTAAVVTELAERLRAIQEQAEVIFKQAGQLQGEIAEGDEG